MLLLRLAALNRSLSLSGLFTSGGMSLVGFEAEYFTPCHSYTDKAQGKGICTAIAFTKGFIVWKNDSIIAI